MAAINEKRTSIQAGPGPDDARPRSLIDELFVEVLSDSHRYIAGLDHRQPVLTPARLSPGRARWRAGRERARDLVEQLAARSGFSHQHFHPDVAASRLTRLVELGPGLQDTYELLGDLASRRAMVDLLKLRVLGPHHVRLAVTPQEFRNRQAQVDREWRIATPTFEVSDPWFSPLSLYRIPLDGGHAITMHGHSVDLVSVFALGQYAYGRGTERISVEPGDVVLDLGGCWGDTALYFSHLVGPQGRVYTFEFDAESLAVLRANLVLNPELASRIEVVEKAVWHRSGDTLDFSSAGRCTTLTDAPASPSGETVETVSVDDFVASRGLDRVDFVKMDIEGAEANALRGAQASLRRYAPKLAIAAYHHDDDLVTLPEHISSSGPAWRFYLGSFSPVEEETVLFAKATSVSSST